MVNVDTDVLRQKRISPDDLSELVGAIYDCALDPSQWPDTLGKIRHLMGADSVALSLGDLRNDRRVVRSSVGFDADRTAETQRHLPEIHARLNEWFACNPHPDAPYVCSRELDPDYLDESPYVQDSLRPRGVVDVMHQFLTRTPTYFTELSITRHERHGLVTRREVEIAALLLPHIRRAVSIGNIMDMRATERDCIADALGALRCGVVIADGEARILHVNDRADHMLREGTVVARVGGFLNVRVQAAARELRAAIRLATEDDAARSRVGLAVRLTEQEAPPIFAHVLPLGSSGFRAQMGSQTSAVIFIGGTAPVGFDRTPAETRAFLRHEFRLTDAEADVALEIMKGDGRAAAAARLGIAVTTVRAHLSHIYEKTRVRRQAELVRLVMQGRPETSP